MIEIKIISSNSPVYFNYRLFNYECRLLIKLSDLPVSAFVLVFPHGVSSRGPLPAAGAAVLAGHGQPQPPHQSPQVPALALGGNGLVAAFGLADRRPPPLLPAEGARGVSGRASVDGVPLEKL